MKNKRVLISGASIAGPVLAFWLRRYGFEPTVVERAPALRPGGYAVDFRGASLRVLERMGLLPEVQHKQTRIGAITMVDRENKKVASMPDGFTSGELEILRGDLAAIFYQATREKTEYIFDDSIVAIEQSDAGVEVKFERGGGRRFDLVQSLEVAEHLPGSASAAFVALLVRHSRGLILFSAAPPGQGGENHINEQSYDFWRGHFRDWGYHAIDWIRPRLAGDKTISYWYRYNVILYASEPMLEHLPAEVLHSKVPEDEPIPDVSPRLFQVRKQVMQALPQSVILAMVRIKAQFYSR